MTVQYSLRLYSEFGIVFLGIVKIGIAKKYAKYLCLNQLSEIYIAKTIFCELMFCEYSHLHVTKGMDIF